MGNQSAFHFFPFDSFEANPDAFDIRLAGCRFTSDSLYVQLPDLQIDLHFRNSVPWPRVHGIPGVMGVFTFVPFMQCYHGVVSMNHVVNGVLTMGGQKIPLKDALGYIEKDWGSSFPDSWIWMQSNSFQSKEPASFMFSLAHIPWMGSYFNGFLCGLWIDGTLHRFATYTAARVSGNVKDNVADICIKQGKKMLLIRAERDDGGDLLSPVKGEMIGKVNESMRSHIDLQFFENGVNRFSARGSYAGMEFSGDVMRLFT